MKTKKILALLLSAILLVSCFTVSAQDTVTTCIKNVVASTPDTAPVADGTLSAGEYGDPVIVTNPEHANAADDDVLQFVDMGTDDTSAEQMAKIYMTNDEDYLYIAATMDHAIDAAGKAKEFSGALALTLSKYDAAKNVYQNNGKSNYLWVISRFNVGESAPNWARITGNTAPLEYKTEDVSVVVKYENGTYTHEMKIAWSAIPGMENGMKNDGKLAMTVKFTDGSTASKQQNYYQVGGANADSFYTAKHDSVLTLNINKGYMKNAVSEMPTSTPTVNGEITPSEYGDPIIVTSPLHVADDGDEIKFVNVNDVSEQLAKIYMTNDEEYLYVAATLDNATVNGSSVGRDEGAAFRITLAKYDATNNIYQKTFGWFAVRFKEDSADFGTGLKKVINKNDGGALQADLIGMYAENAYTYEMRIPWSQIPGMENGMYADNDLAMTVNFSDGTETPGEYNYYQIGGTAAGDIWNGNHDTVHTVTINEGKAKDTVSDMPAVAPTVDGMLNAGEYGEPVIVTSQNHTATLEGNSMFVNRGTNTTPRAQRATIYMTNDDEYLYIAATLDHAIAVKASLPKECNGLFAVMLSNTKNMFKNEAGKKEYFWGISRFNSGASSPTGGRVLGTVYTANANVSIVGAYDNGTYIHEMRIPWSAIPGMESGINTEGKLAINLMLTDGGGGTDKDAPKQNYYQIGDAEANNIFNAKHNQAMALNVCKEANFRIGDATYFTVDKALDAATSGQPVTLLDSVTVENLTILDGKTLDLAGHALTATTVITYGDIKDSSSGEGIIKVQKNVKETDESEAKNYLILQSSNSMLPLYDNKDEGYRFFGFGMINKGQQSGTKEEPDNSNVMRYGVHLSFESKKAYELMADGTLDVGLIMNLTTENDTLTAGGIEYTIRESTLKTYATECVNDFDDKTALEKNTIVLIVTGMNALNGDTLQVTAKLDTITDMIPSVDVVKK